MWNLRAMYFEFREVWRKVAIGKMQRPWASPPPVGRCSSLLSQPQAPQRRHTYADSEGRRAAAMMRKIESWL